MMMIILIIIVVKLKIHDQKVKAEEILIYIIWLLAWNFFPIFSGKRNLFYFCSFYSTFFGH